MEIFSVTDERFRKYGKVWNGMECVKILREMEHTPLPEDVIYVSSVEEKEWEDALMTAKNKWLIAHEEAGIEGAFNGLRGENLTIRKE